MKVKEENEKVDLKLNIQKTKIMASSLITSWQIDGRQWKKWQTLFCFGAPKSAFFYGFPGGSEDKAFACNAGDPGLIPGLGRPLEKEMATHSSILAWRIPWTEEPGGLQSTGLQRVGHDWANSFIRSFILSAKTNCVITVFCCLQDYSLAKRFTQLSLLK